MKRLFLLLTWLIALPIGMLAQGTTWQSATTINSGETKSGSLYGYENSERNDEWYKIVVPEEGTVEFTLTPGGNLDINFIKVFRLKDDGELEQRNYSGIGKEEKVVSITDIGIGTYYVQIHRWSGGNSYTMKYKFTACPIGNDAEPNNEYDKGSLLESGKTIDCRLGYTDDTGLTDNDDWFKIEVPEEGKIEFTIDPSQGIDLDINFIKIFRLKNDRTLEQRNYFGIGKEKKVITITDLGIGTFYVQIHRWSGHGGYTMKYEFTRVDFVGDDEPNDEWSEDCALLKSGENIECKLGFQDANGVTDNDDWFKIIVPQEGKVEFTLNPSQENELDINFIKVFRLRDDGELEQRNYSGIGKEETVVSITDIGIGTYYVQIHRWSGHGGYTMKYEFTPCPIGNDSEPNNEYDKGSLLISGKTIDCRLGYTDDTGLTDNDDWFKIEVPEEGKIEFTIDPSQGIDLDINFIKVFRLRDDGELEQRNYSGIGKEEKVVSITDIGIGTYYVQIHRWSGHGGYTMKYEFTPCPIANDPEPNKEFTESSLLKSGETIGCRLGYTDDTGYTDDDDWFKIEVTKDGKAEFTLNPSQENELDINFIKVFRLKDDGGLEQRNYSGIGKEEKVYSITDLGIGTYYLQVHRWSGHGGYTLKYVFTPNPYIGDEEPNNEYENAQTLVKGEKVMAHLGYADDTGYRDDDDWYKFDIDIIGTPSLTIVPNQTYELDINWVRVYTLKDGELKELKYQGVGKYQAGTYLSYYDKGTYYVQVHRWSGHGGYTLLYDEEPIRYFDDEPNDDVSQAVIIHDGETKVGNIGFKKDEENYDINDWFKVTVDEGSQLMFSYDPDQGEGIDATLYLWYDNGGTMEPVTVKYNQGGLKSGTSAWAHLQSLNIMTDENMKGGTYYLDVHRNSGMGTYTMTFNIARRTLDSKVRVHYIGWPSVRKGIPGSFDITVENTGSTPSGSFFLCIPYTEDIKLLSAFLPDNQGGRTIDASEMSDEESHNAVLLFPGLNPHEKYTFTVWAEGYVEGKYDARGVSKIDPVLTVLGIMAINFIADVGYSMVEDNIKSGLAHLANTNLQTEEVTSEFSRAYGVAEDEIRVKKEEYNMCAHGFKTVLKKTGESVNKSLGLEVVNKVMGLVEDMKSVADAARRKFMVKYGRAAFINKFMEEFESTTEIMDEETGANNIVSSWDPNEMVGPVGYGDERYIGGEAKTINYRILFENKAEATAPAYRIRITDVLDENVFDISSVRFGDTSHDVGTGWKMKRDGNKLSWDIEGIELPPNVNAPEGEGYVTFSVDLKPGLKNLTEVKNMATIIFDYNDPIETNEYVNTLDLGKPEGEMASAFYSGSNVKLKGKGSDEESGISRYKFYASKNDGEFEL
ncbi:MAG: hypothetical protein IK075_04885, partial [Prevotella sp.]|nr:hypothetical protein [Prevotella sp.]